MSGVIEEMALLALHADESDKASGAAWARGDYAEAWALKQLADQTRIVMEAIAEREAAS